MRISELSRRSGVSIPTIKYYLRDGLLPADPDQGADQPQPAHMVLVVLGLVGGGGAARGQQAVP